MHFHFLKELKTHLQAYEAQDPTADTTAIAKFLAFVDGQYVAPAPAVVAPPAPLAVPAEPTYTAPVVDTPVAEEVAPDVQETIAAAAVEPAPVVDTTPATEVEEPAAEVSAN